MRILLIFIIMVLVTNLKAQTPLPGNFQDNNYEGTFARTHNLNDSNTQKKWFISRYAGITTGYSFFSHGSAGFVAAPAGLQLNRRLNNNLFAFAAVTVAPVYTNFNNAFLNTYPGRDKFGNSFYQPAKFSVSPAATMGLMYINNERTFSVSGSIRVENNSYPLYNNSFYTARPNNVMPSNR